MQRAAVILAAGKGTRMKSELPKVLHKICGRPMLDYVTESLNNAGIENITIVVGHRGDMVAKNLPGNISVVNQDPQLGTAHALLQAKERLEGFSGNLLVIGGDTPLITQSSLKNLLEYHENIGARATVLTAELIDPGNYGRVIRETSGRVLKIVEQRDASQEELAIREINTGIYVFSGEGLFEALSEIKNNNAQKEYYLTDLIEKYVKAELPVEAYKIKDAGEIMGINDRCQLAEVESNMRQRILTDLMLSGVTVIDPKNTYVDREVKVGQDTTILPFTIIEGRSSIGPNCTIGPGTHLIDVQVGTGAVIRNSIIMESLIGNNCNIGPFAYIRPGCVLEQEVKVGDFVELKKAKIGVKSKVPHLSYIGDTTMGSEVNIGAGTITCNYDGSNKWPTMIGNRAFVGSNTNFVAPVEIGSGAVIGAGSTITKNVPENTLSIARGRQKNIEGYNKKITAKEKDL
ncbi:MAG TPA: bifunctional UDP-N-acetylglucosamine diphosphorylase/glucosamine-1-phosphate N-acetyltransferase GlmU [Desulfotomaculum sp.]|nr:MAG: Bifunctional protein GlmU [Desulfotomaculum sp. 46_80]HBY04175.1 bifunctional UDP-N-acetylglucosamine diphosphorylase/glucosamine-1-phosphate N-acetyltransferase GlmU [Desulfotomaculum sp.]